MLQRHEEQARNAAPRWRTRTLRRLVRKQDGTAAVEFGFVAAPFLALIFAIMETAIVFFAGQTLETAVADSARLIMTGQAQTQGFNQAAFKNAVCAKIYGLFDCANGIYVDVKTYTSFANINLTPAGRHRTATSRTTRAISPAVPATSWSCGCSINGRSTSRCLACNMSGNKRLLIATVRVPQRTVSATA